MEWQPIETAPNDKLVIVYSPPDAEDWPDTIRIDFDYIDTGIAEGYWYHHGEAHEHFQCVGKPSGSVGGVSEKAPYTHWMHIPKPPVTP